MSTELPEWERDLLREQDDAMVREDERCLVADRLAEHRDTLAAFAADKPRLVDLIVYLIRTQMPDGLPGPDVEHTSGR
jgi:hypothetical protein